MLELTKDWSMDERSIFSAILKHKVYELSSGLSEGYKRPSRERKELHVTPPCPHHSFNSYTVFTVYQVIFYVLTNSCHRQLLPFFHHNFLLYPLITRPETEHSLCWEVLSFEESSLRLFLQQIGMDNTSLSFVSALMFTEVPDSALQAQVLFTRIDLTLVKAVGISHGFWRGICPSCSVRSTLRLTSHPSIPGLWSLISRNAANPSTRCLKTALTLQRSKTPITTVI